MEITKDSVTNTIKVAITVDNKMAVVAKTVSRIGGNIWKTGDHHRAYLPRVFNDYLQEKSGVSAFDAYYDISGSKFCFSLWEEDFSDEMDMEEIRQQYRALIKEALDHRK